MKRALATAQHEAAHVVVGVALGLRLREAVIGEAEVAGERLEGYAWFPGANRLDWGITLAAGVARSRAHGAEGDARLDLAELRRLRFSARNVESLVIAAWAILTERSEAHARVTAALLQRDLVESDIALIAEGLPLPEEPDEF